MYDNDPPGAGRWREFRQSGIDFLLAPQIYGDLLESRLNRDGLSMVNRVSLYEGGAPHEHPKLLTKELAGPWTPAFSWWGDSVKDGQEADFEHREGEIHWRRTGNKWRVLSDVWLLLMLDELKHRQAMMLSALVGEVEASYAGRQWQIARDLVTAGKAANYPLYTLENMGLIKFYMLEHWVGCYGREFRHEAEIGDRQLDQLKKLPKPDRNQSIEGKIVARGDLLDDFWQKLVGS